MSRILGLTTDPNGVPLDPKAYELKVQAICLPRTEYTVKKQAQDNHSEHRHLKRGKAGRHRPLTILNSFSTHAAPFPHSGAGQKSWSRRWLSHPWGWEHWLLAPPSGTSSFPITLLPHFWWVRRKMCKTLGLLPAVKFWGFRGLLQFWITLI